MTSQPIADLWALVVTEQYEQASQLAAAMTTPAHREEALCDLGNRTPTCASELEAATRNLLYLVEELLVIGKADKISVDARWNIVLSRLSKSQSTFDAASHDTSEILKGIPDDSYEFELSYMLRKLESLKRDLEETLKVLPMTKNCVQMEPA
jgi:hypothetical protein